MQTENETKNKSECITADTNIWALDKDPCIKAILLSLLHEVGTGRFVLIGEQNLHHQAVRIASAENQTELCVYIYCYAQRRERYGVDLEFPYLMRTAADDQTVRLNDLSSEQAIEEIIDHLELNPAAG